RNGSGDDYYILFSDNGAILKGYAHEAPLARYYVQHEVSFPGVVDHVPPAFADFLAEPAFEPRVATFCLWRQFGDAAWQIGTVTLPEGKDPDGSADLMRILDGNPQTYRDWAQDYFELWIENEEEEEEQDEYEAWEIPLAAVERVYRHEPLSEELVALLN